MFFLLLCCVVISFSFDLEKISLYQEISWYFLVFTPVFFVWLFVCLAETNRSPFDFAEGESELVSGFNVEYGGVGFAYIFMAEYGMIIFICCFSVVVFLGGVRFLWLSGVLVFFWIWARARFPRIRYDRLMIMA